MIGQTAAAHLFGREDFVGRSADGRAIPAKHPERRLLGCSADDIDINIRAATDLIEGQGMHRSKVAAAWRCPSALWVHDAPQVLPPIFESASSADLVNEQERMLDRGVPPLAIGQSVAVNQSALLSSLKTLATRRIKAATQPNCQIASCQNVSSS